MSRRLSEMVEETIDAGSKSDRRNLHSASNNFSEELKAQLEARIADSSFKHDNQKAIGQANIPSYAGKGTKDISAAAHWEGTETVEDAALRMLDDSHKKLRGSPRPPRIPPVVNLRPATKKAVSQGARLANARDKTSIYAFSQQDGMSEEEREKLRKELKERFTPGARPMPATLQGLTSLANERIEDAIARGQFRNIKRGKDVNVERDYNANSPFLDTTEYFMNKIIQKQEIVPPWIEKQQEMAKLIDSFRKRLRSDWRRHAARMIASEGGTVESQINRAKGYALAEEIVNPRVTDNQKVSGISSDGSIINISVEDRIAGGIQAEKHEVTVEVTAVPSSDVAAADIEQLEQELEKEMQAVASASAAVINATTMPSASTTTSAEVALPQPPDRQPSSVESTTIADTTPPPSPLRVLPMSTPFRDPAWQATEHAYHTLAVAEINSLTRSYNLMAPKIAQKPYTNLDRELKRCFAIVAPQLADEIAERSRKGVVKGFGERYDTKGRMSVLDRFGSGGKQGPVLHERLVINEEAVGKGYGFKEFWRDLFGKDGKKRKGDWA